jgi:uncharacterized protein YdeI (YjbR/CyaY-like superfamily)
MQITKTLYVVDRKSWRAWLRKNFRKEKEIWLVHYRKEAGKPHVSYNDAVEEALCFGWIDSTIKKLDDERFVQRYLPRNRRSDYSQTNKERLQKMISKGQVRKDVLAGLGDITPENYVFPDDIMKILRANRQAYANFIKYSASYQRIRIAYIDSARIRPTEFDKRLKNFLKLTEQNKQFGYGIKSFF